MTSTFTAFQKTKKLIKMKLYVSIIIIILFANPGFSQKITGQAFYTSMYKAEKTELTTKQKENPRIKELAEQLNQAFTDDFVLEFTQEESVFKKQPKLKKPNPTTEGKITISRSMMGDEEILYKNLRTNNFLNNKEVYGKLFLIQDTIKTYEWQLSKETKTIGEYICFKATYVPMSEETDDNLIEDGKIKKEIIAWYTPQIPVKNGPMEYGGLPGLILEVQDGNQKLLCSKIVLNPVEKLRIKKPNKGKKVTKQEFNSIVEKKSKEMMENFKTQMRRE